MFGDEQPPVEEKKPTDYSGLIVAAIVAPVYFLFLFLGKAEMGFPACLVLGTVMHTVKISWRLRKYLWFWAEIVFIVLLNIPLFFVIQWPQGDTLTIAYTLPLATADLLIIRAAIGLGEKFFLKNSSLENEEE